MPGILWGFESSEPSSLLLSLILNVELITNCRNDYKWHFQPAEYESANNWKVMRGGEGCREIGKGKKKSNENIKLSFIKNFMKYQEKQGVKIW